MLKPDVDAAGDRGEAPYLAAVWISRMCRGLR